MVLTRRMAKLQATNSGDSAASENTVAPVQSLVGDTAAEMNAAVCENAARGAVGLVAPTHGTSHEGNGALRAKIHGEDVSTSTGPRSVDSYNAENTEGTSTYRLQQEDRGEAQPQTGPRAMQADGHFLDIPHAQTVSAQNEYHGERHSSALSPAPRSPMALGQSETTKKPRKRKGTRTRWSRTKGQRTKAKSKANEPTQNAKATQSTSSITNTAGQWVPLEDRPMKRLPQRAVKTAEINEAVRKAEATARKGKWKANTDKLPSTREAPTGSKRARNERPFDIEDNIYLRVDPGPSRTTRRIRQRTVAPSFLESPAPIEAPSARQLRRRHVNIPSKPLRVVVNKRKACILDLVDEDRITKRRKLDLASPPRPSASDIVTVKFGPPPYLEPPALPLGQVKRKHSTPAPLHPSPPSFSSSPERRPLLDACPKQSYLEVGEEDDEMRDAEDAPDVADADQGREDLGWVLARPSQRLDEEELLPLRTTSDTAKDATETIDADDVSKSASNASQPSRALSSARNRQELLIGGGERLPLGPRSQTSTTTIPTPSVVPAPPPAPYQPPAPVRPEPRVELRQLFRALTPRPCPDWFVTTAQSSRDTSRSTSSESSFPRTPNSSPSTSRFTSRSSSRSSSPARSLPPLRELRERSMAPEPSDELIEALRAGRVSICPSPSPTERDMEE